MRWTCSQTTLLPYARLAGPARLGRAAHDTVGHGALGRRQARQLARILPQQQQTLARATGCRQLPTHSLQRRLLQRRRLRSCALKSVSTGQMLATPKHCLSAEERTSARALTTCVHRRRWRRSGRGRALALGLTAGGQRATPLPKTRRHPNRSHAMACVGTHTDPRLPLCFPDYTSLSLSRAHATTLRSHGSLQTHRPQALACRWLLGYFFVQVHVRLAVCIAQQQASTNFMNRTGSEFLCFAEKCRLPASAEYVASQHRPS